MQAKRLHDSSCLPGQTCLWENSAPGIARNRAILSFHDFVRGLVQLLIINPNTTDAMTDKVVAAARLALPPSIQIRSATGRFGASYIASRASFAVAGHAALDAFAAHGAGSDVACFGDPGLEALREVAARPVISLIDASCKEAGMSGRRFSIVTGGERWGPMLSEMIAARGLASQLASIRTVAPSGGAIARDPEGSTALLADACRICAEEDGAEAVILGGAGLIGIAEIIQPIVPIAIICSNAAGFRAAANALIACETQMDGSTDAVVTTGLSAELSALFRYGRLPNQNVALKP
jgi:allantoin racemase